MLRLMSFSKQHETKCTISNKGESNSRSGIILGRDLIHRSKKTLRF
jgi:hypothetical protein